MSHNKRNRGPARAGSAVGQLPHPADGLDDESDLMVTEHGKDYTPRNLDPALGGPLSEGFETAHESTLTTRDAPALPPMSQQSRRSGLVDNDPEGTRVDLTVRGRRFTLQTRTYTQIVARKR